MSQYLLQRLFLNIPVIILVITIVFLMGRARPDFAEQRAAQGLSNAGDYNQALQAVRSGGPVEVAAVVVHVLRDQQRAVRCGAHVARGLVVETPPAQTNGGGLNSSLAPTSGLPLASGASIPVHFLIGVQQGGTYRFFINIEAIP